MDRAVKRLRLLIMGMFFSLMFRTYTRSATARMIPSTPNRTCTITETCIPNSDMDTLLFRVEGLCSPVS